MVNAADWEIAREFKGKLEASGVPVKEFKIYGSRVRGDFTADSDLDICLILKEESPEIEALVSRLAWEVGFNHERIITTVEYTPEQWYHSPLRESPFIKAIDRDGISV